MQSVPEINASASAANVSPSFRALAPALNLVPPGLSGDTGTIVVLSGAGLLLSAAAAFQDRLQPLRPAAADTIADPNPGTDFASLSANAQSFVDAFNSLQGSISNIAFTQPGGVATASSALALSLNAQAEASYANSESALTGLSQLGIGFRPSLFPGGGGSLSVDPVALQAAFDADAAGAFSLLSTVAEAFNDLAVGFVAQAGSQLPALATLAQTSGNSGLLGNRFFFPTQATGNNVVNFLSLASLTGMANAQQVILALREYILVSSLLE
ncbi:MAG: hypothetical protein Q7U91_08885 [Sideroxyarcus sp.]|nr:hypothetical protein [Sideroxyarcus sp.]